MWWLAGMVERYWFHEGGGKGRMTMEQEGWFVHCIALAVMGMRDLWSMAFEIAIGIDVCGGSGY